LENFENRNQKQNRLNDLRRLGWNAQPVLSFNAQLQARLRTVVEGCDGSASIQDFVQKAILSYTIGGERIP
jgi:hypothetical protein